MTVASQRADRGAPAPIVFVINSLEGGGAERIFCDVVQGLQRFIADRKCHVVLLDNTADSYTPPSFARLHRLNAQGGLAASIAGLSKVLADVRPGAVVSFLSRANCANVALSKVYHHRSIISERVATSQHFGGGVKSTLQKILTALLYPRASGVIAVSQGVKRDLVQSFGVSPERVKVIYNPVDVEALQAQGRLAASECLPEDFIVGVGRLTENKNFIGLLDAYARSGLPWDLVVLGEGPLRERLVARAAELGVGARVHFPGFSHNPFAVVRRARFFVSASRAEGFPNALVEAMALGVPVVATNCPSGPAEILGGDADLEVTSVHLAPHGVLVPPDDNESLATAMIYMSDQDHQSDYGARALKRARMFAPKEVYAGYWDTICNVWAN